MARRASVLAAPCEKSEPFRRSASSATGFETRFLIATSYLISRIKLSAELGACGPACHTGWASAAALAGGESAGGLIPLAEIHATIIMRGAGGCSRCWPVSCMLAQVNWLPASAFQTGPEVNDSLAAWYQPSTNGKPGLRPARAYSILDAS